jgi:hypothetical protein
MGRKWTGPLHTPTVLLLRRFTRSGQLVTIMPIARWTRVKARKPAFSVSWPPLALICASFAGRGNRHARCVTARVKLPFSAVSCRIEQFQGTLRVTS